MVYKDQLKCVQCKFLQELFPIVYVITNAPREDLKECFSPKSSFRYQKKTGYLDGKILFSFSSWFSKIMKEEIMHLCGLSSGCLRRPLWDILKSTSSLEPESFTAYFIFGM